MLKIHEHVGSSVGHTVVEDGLDKELSTYYWQAVFVPMFTLFGLYIVYVTRKAFEAFLVKNV